MEQENLTRKLEDNLANLFELAHHDPALKRELLHDPQKVAERYGVKFSDDEVKQLQKLGALTDLTDDIKVGRLFPRPPIFYPINIWEIKELLEVFYRLLPGTIITYPGPGPIFYPAANFNQMTAFTTRAYRPGWVTYPGDDQGGGTGRGTGGIRGGGIVPGPIFYPISLINFMRERLVQILQVRFR